MHWASTFIWERRPVQHSMMVTRSARAPVVRVRTRPPRQAAVQTLIQRVVLAGTPPPGSKLLGQPLPVLSRLRGGVAVEERLGVGSDCHHLPARRLGQARARACDVKERSNARVRFATPSQPGCDCSAVSPVSLRLRRRQPWMRWGRQWRRASSSPSGASTGGTRTAPASSSTASASGSSNGSWRSSWSTFRWARRPSTAHSVPDRDLRLCDGDRGGTPAWYPC